MTECTCGTLRLIGDVHGDYNALELLRERHNNAIQIGDMGLGFSTRFDRKIKRVIEYKSAIRFFRGNHDDPVMCRRHKQHLASGYHDEGFFVVGGGLSIDRERRTENVNWWADEEHSKRELEALIERYIATRPRLVLSHEGPPQATDAMFNPQWKFESATAQALQTMWELWKPDLWVFGHWHRTREVKDGNTLFVCLGEKERRDVHLPSCPLFEETATTSLQRVGARLAKIGAPR